MKNISALSIPKLRELWGNVYRIATGCKALDNLLRGGFPSSHTTLIYGERSSGKTQLCHQVTAHYLITNKDRYAVYVDVDLAFTPSRLLNIANRFKKIEAKDVLPRILYYKPSSFEDQARLVDLLYEVYDQAPHDLVLIDSLSTLIRGEYGIAVIERQRALSNYIRRLQEYALRKNVVIIMTDNVHLVKQLNREMLLPISSQALEISMTRLRLIKAIGAKRICRIESSPILPEEEAIFSISEEGLVDI